MRFLICCILRPITWIIFLFTFLSQIYSQTETIDSLIIELEQAGSDSLEAALNLQLAIEIKSHSLPKSFAYVNKALEITTREKLKDNIEGKVYGVLADNYGLQGSMDSSKMAVDRCLDLSLTYEDSLTYSMCLMELGSYYSMAGEHDKSLETLIRAKDISEQKGYENVLLNTLNELGRFHLGLGNYADCIKAFEQALLIAEPKGYHDQVAKLYINLSIVHDSIPLVKGYAFKAIDIAEENNLKRVKAYAYNAAAMYYTYYVDKPDSSIIMLNQVKNVASDIGENALYIRSMRSIAEAYSYINLDSAIYYYNVLLAAKDEYAYSEEMYMESLAKLYRRNGQIDEAYETLDSAYAQAKRRYRSNLEDQVADANAKYETEKKEAELARQELVIEKQNSTRNMLLGGGVALLAVLGSVFYGYRSRTQRREQEKEQALEIAKQRADNLEELAKAKTDFFNNINHELRTPLSLVLAPLQDVRKKVKHVDVLNDVDMAIKNSKRLLSLTDEIMDLAKLDDGKLQIYNSEVTLSPFVNRVFTAFSSLAESRNIELQMIGELPSGISIGSDISKLEKVLNNLISNAIKYSESGDTVSLEVDSNSLDQNLLKFSVSDTGLGIPEDEASMIFDRYYQSSITPQSSGTGIGLAFVKELCELMGGKINVQSVIGQGSRFTVELPVEISENVEEQHSEIVESPIISEDVLPISIDGEKAKVLIVEDNEEMSQYLKGLLADSYNCTTAVNGKDAIDLLRQERFDLISSDIMMPELDGFEFRKQVNQHVAWRDIPFIMLTARTLESDKLDAFQLGIDDYITKPFSSEEYKARVNSLLKNRQSRLEVKDEELSPEQDLINRAKALVVEHIDDSSYKVGDLSSDLNYSSRQLGRIIKKTTGFTPVEFILEIRLLRAYDLIKSRQFSTVNEVRYQIGIDSHSYFTTKFKERFGVSPGDLE